MSLTLLRAIQNRHHTRTGMNPEGDDMTHSPAIGKVQKNFQQSHLYVLKSRVWRDVLPVAQTVTLDPALR